MKTQKIFLFGVEQMLKFAGFLAQSITPGTPIALHGDLGTGKTVFARGFAKQIGVQEIVTSPTFVILQEYNTQNGFRLCHFDLYRINNVSAALDFGMDEYLRDPQNYCLVEWPERAESIFPEETLHLYFNRTEKHAVDEDEEREIEIVGNSEFLNAQWIQQLHSIM